MDIEFIRSYRSGDGVIDPVDMKGLFTILEFVNLDEAAVAQGYTRTIKFNLYSFKKTHGVPYLIDKGMSEAEAVKLISDAENL